MKIFVSFLFNVTLFFSSQAQGTTSYTDTTITLSETIALARVALFTLPLALGGATLSIVPPSGGVVWDEEEVSGLLSFTTGFGFGKKLERGVFANTRFLIGYTHIFHDEKRNFLQIEITRDFHYKFIDRRKILLLGASHSFGVFTDFISSGIMVGASVWLMTPTLPYIFFFPLHTIGIQYQYHRYFSGNNFHSLSIGISSAFTFAW